MSGRARGRGRGDFLAPGGDDHSRRPLRRPGDSPSGPDDQPAPRRPGDSPSGPNDRPAPRRPGESPGGPDDRPAPRRPGESPSGPNDQPAPRRPGDDVSSNNVEAEVRKLSISAKPSEEEISSMLQGIPNDAQLLEALRDLHELALTCRSVGTGLAAAAGRLQAEATEGSHLRNLRTHMLNFVQNNYKRRHDDRMMSPARFAGAAWLLCEVFRSVRLADGSVVRVLVPPILEYLTALLHCRQEDQVLAAAQLCRVGAELNRCSPEGVAEMVNSIRERLTSPDCSHALRADFLLCVELSACGWTALSPHALHFYAHHGVSVPDADEDECK